MTCHFQGTVLGAGEHNSEQNRWDVKSRKCIVQFCNYWRFICKLINVKDIPSHEVPFLHGECFQVSRIKHTFQIIALHSLKKKIGIKRLIDISLS